MSDEQGFMDEEGQGGSSGQDVEVGGKPGFLPAVVITILKYAAIVIALVIAIVVVANIVFSIREGMRTADTMPGVSKEITQVRPIYMWFDTIGEIRGRTADESPHTVIVAVSLGFDDKNKVLGTELAQRVIELKDLIRSYFATKTKKDLSDEQAIKKELREIVNNRLKGGKIEEIAFPSFNIIEF